MMTGNGVMQNGTTIIEMYGQNLDKLQVGDCVGVVVRDDGIERRLHFFVNNIDQGENPKFIIYSNMTDFHKYFCLTNLLKL